MKLTPGDELTPAALSLPDPASSIGLKPLAYGLGSEQSSCLPGLAPLPSLDALAGLADQPVVAKPLPEVWGSGSLSKQLDGAEKATSWSTSATLSSARKADVVTGLTRVVVREVPDFADDTTTTASIVIGGSASGVVNVNYDRDWFRLSLQAGRSYRFNLNGGTLTDPTLALRDASGSQLAFNDDFNGRDSQIDFTASTTATYYLDAGAYSSGIGSYTLLAADTTPVDDFAANSSTTGSVAIGGSASGVVNFNGDRDWFRLSLQAGRSYRFNLNGGSLSDPTLTLRDASGNQLAFNDDFNGRDSQIDFTATTTATYYLDAGAYNSGTGSYTLLAADTTPVDDFAGSSSTTGSVAIGGSASGVVNFNGDRDWFRLSLQAGRSYRFNLNGGSLSDPTLALRNASGNQLAFNDDFNGRDSQIDFTASTTATYYLDAGAYSNGTGSYTLLAADTTPVDDFAGSSSTTGSVAIGGSASGVVNFNGDRDWFRLSLQAGRSYRFNLNGGSLSDPTLALRNASGGQLAFNDDFNGRDSQLDFTATTTATYYLDAGAYSSGTGSYTLLAADTTPVDDFAASSSTTGSVAIGGSASGVVNFNGDRDWFRLSLQAGATYRFILNGTTLSDPTLALRDASGSQLAFNDDYNGRNSQIDFTATATATYFLDAGAYSSGTGSYTLLAENTTPAPTIDDFTASTSTTGTIAIGGSASGVVNFTGDRDWFRLSLLAGRTYRFNLNGNSLSDPSLALRDGSGSQLAYNDDFNGLNSQITYTAVTGGTYYLDAGAINSGTGTYSLLAADTTPAPTLDDFAASTSTTGSISIGGSTSGVVNFNGDRDWFRLSLQSGRTYNFSVVGGSLSDPDLYLRNSTGLQLGYASDSGGARNPILTYTANTTGTFYLDVGSNVNVGSGSYTAFAVDLINNDDFLASTSTTGSIVIGSSISGRVDFNGDRDWFRVSLQSGTTYRFNLNGNTLADPSLALRDVNGSQIAFNDDFNGQNSQITFTATTTGTYYLDAGASSLSTSGSYTLATALAPASTDDYTADSTSQGRVTIGGQASGVIDFAGDHDWFRVALQAGRTYRFDLNGTTLSNPILQLLDSSGRSTLATNDDFGTGRNSQITYTALSTGDHFLDAAAVGSLTGTYLLQTADISATVDRITGLLDPTIRTSVNTLLSDNLLTHQELSTLLRTAGTNGVTAQELSDLRAIANQFSTYLADTNRSYTQYIFNAVVNGNTANQWWTGGASSRVSLGNLTAGSIELQMNRLVDKWFGGLDLPTNFVGGDTAAAASSLTFTYGRMTGPLFENDINFSDVNQGQAGTCYFLAACSTLANNQRQLIRDMFRDNGDGTYGVRFYSSTGNQLWVTVNTSVPIYSDNTLALAGNASGSLSGEMWVALAEKAYAQANEIGVFGRSTTANSYSQIEGGLEEALRHISGRSTTTYSADWSNQGWTSAAKNLTTWNTYETAAISAVNAGKSLWLGSFGNTYDSNGKRNLISGHAFAITGYNSVTRRFIVANPWGAGSSSYAGVFESSWRDLFNVRGVVSWV